MSSSRRDSFVFPPIRPDRVGASTGNLGPSCWYMSMYIYIYFYLFICSACVRLSFEGAQFGVGVKGRQKNFKTPVCLKCLA